MWTAPHRSGDPPSVAAQFWHRGGCKRGGGSEQEPSRPPRLLPPLIRAPISAPSRGLWIPPASVPLEKPQSKLCFFLKLCFSLCFAEWEPSPAGMSLSAEAAPSRRCQGAMLCTASLFCHRRKGPKKDRWLSDLGCVQGCSLLLTSYPFAEYLGFCPPCLYFCSHGRLQQLC